MLFYPIFDFDGVIYFTEFFPVEDRLCMKTAKILKIWRSYCYGIVCYFRDLKFLRHKN